MKKVRHLGWVLSASFLAILVGSGFQKPADKYGIIDLLRIRKESEYAKTRTAQLQELDASQRSVMEFVQTFHLFTADQAKRFKELSLKPKRSAEEETELSKIKTDVQDASKKYQDLQVKNPPSPAEAAQLRDYANREAAMSDTANAWATEFKSEYEKLSLKVDEEFYKALDSSIKEVGAKQGFSLVFSREAAPYCPNDLTDDLIKVLNKK